MQACYLCHRVDLHNELKRRAIEEGVEIHLHSRIASCDAEHATITTASGEIYEGDVVIGADGIRVRRLSASMCLLPDS